MIRHLMKPGQPLFLSPAPESFTIDKTFMKSFSIHFNENGVQRNKLEL